MDTQSILLLIVASINVAFGIFIYHQDRRSPVHASYASFAWFLALWEVSIAFFRFSNVAEYAMTWMRAAYIGATGIGGSFLYFTLYFPRLQQHLLVKRVMIIVATSALLIAFTVPDFLVKAIVVRAGVRGTIVGRIELILFTIFFVGVFYGALASLFFHWRKAVGVLKYQIFYIFMSVLIAGVVGSVCNLLLVYLDDYRFIWLGPLFPLIIVVATGYAIVRHHLMDIRVIAAEVLTMSLILIMLLEFFLSATVSEYIIRGVLFIFVTIFGVSLIRSVIREVRQREQLEVMTNELEAANKELARLDQAKSEFLSIASHQLRTPLTAIKGYSSMILDGTYGKMTTKVRGAMGKVYEATERMVALVNDLLDSSRLESGRMKFAFEEVDLGTIAKSVCEELTIKATEKHLKIACSLPKRALPKVWVDTMKIRQVIGNYIDNAVKYSDTGVVEVHLEAREAELIFAVRDRGWGMTPEEMQFLFKKFSRGRGDTSLIKGTGLGLYVCRRLVEAHGGRVWAESEGKGKGSTFFFALRAGWKPSPEGVYLPKEE